MLCAVFRNKAFLLFLLLISLNRSAFCHLSLLLFNLFDWSGFSHLNLGFFNLFDWSPESRVFQSL